MFSGGVLLDAACLLPIETEAQSTFSPPVVQQHSLLVEKVEGEVADADYEDAMMNDWGIHHLHLGTTVDAGGFVDRTGPVLYARLEPKDVYLLTVMEHGEWANQQLVQIIHDNWPRLLDRYRLRGVTLPSSVTDGDIKRLRKGGVNTILRVTDGTVSRPSSNAMEGKKRKSAPKKHKRYKKAVCALFVSFVAIAGLDTWPLNPIHLPCFPAVSSCRGIEQFPSLPYSV